MFRQFVRALLFLGSFIAVLVSVRLATIARPLDLVEVVVLERAAAFANGGRIYAEPSHLDDPAIMPGLPLAVAPLVATFGPDAWQPRAVALVCLLLIALLVLKVVRLETSNWTLAVTSVGFLAMGFNLMASPPGVVRPELLMLPLVLAGFLALRLSDDFGGPLLAAVAFTAGLYTAPQAGWYIAAAFVSLALDSRQRLLVFTLVFAILAGGLHVLLSGLWGPWFNFGAWGDPLAELQWNPAAPLLFVGGDLLGKLGVLTFAAVLSFALPTAPWRGKGGLWMCFGLAALVEGLVATQTSGFGSEALIPSLVALALLGPVSMQRVLGHLAAWPGSNRLAGQGVVLTALTLQFVMFFASSLASMQGM